MSHNYENKPLCSCLLSISALFGALRRTEADSFQELGNMKNYELTGGWLPVGGQVGRCYRDIPSMSDGVQSSRNMFEADQMENGWATASVISFPLSNEDCPTCV